jgi:aldehyde dehydrogenase
MIANQEQLVAAIAKEVVARLEERLGSVSGARLPASGNHSLGDDGVFPAVDEAVQAAAAAQQRVAAMSLEDRGRMVTIIRRQCHDNAEEWARLELDETRIGRADHKAAKLRNIRLVPGAEAMQSEALSDTSGLCVIEHAPWGVIGMVLPATHSVPTMASNAINILAAGNTAVFSPHPTGC